MISLFIYKPFDTSTLNFDEIEEYILKRFPGIHIEIKENILANKEDLAEPLAKIRVTDINEEKENVPLRAEIEYEERCLRGQTPAKGILYDGFKLRQLLFTFLTKEDRRLDNIHIVLTNRLIGTFDDEDKRYHARTNILGLPSLISLSGIVEAPAKPREFYLLKQKNIPIEVLKEEFKGRFIDHDDERLTELIKGFFLRSIFYQLFGEGFCEDVDCRLFNAHWQEELIRAQLGEKELCEKHEEMLRLKFVDPPEWNTTEYNIGQKESD